MSPTLAVLFVDLDGFKPMNDRFGHAAGDEVLRIVAQRLSDSVRRDGTVARLGGDEFVVLCPHVPNRAAAAAIGERVLAALDQPFHVRDEQWRLSASIGLTLARSDEPHDQVLHRADLAMYEAKLAGGARVHLHDDAGQASCGLPVPRVSSSGRFAELVGEARRCTP